MAPFVIAVPPGTGKSQHMKAAVDDKTSTSTAGSSTDKRMLVQFRTAFPGSFSSTVTQGAQGEFPMSNEENQKGIHINDEDDLERLQELGYGEERYGPRDQTHHPGLRLRGPGYLVQGIRPGEQG